MTFSRGFGTNVIDRYDSSNNLLDRSLFYGNFDFWETPKSLHLDNGTIVNTLIGDSDNFRYRNEFRFQVEAQDIDLNFTADYAEILYEYEQFRHDYPNSSNFDVVSTANSEIYAAWNLSLTSETFNGFSIAQIDIYADGSDPVVQTTNHFANSLHKIIGAPSMSASNDGGFFVDWEATEYSDGAHEIFIQEFTFDGQPKSSFVKLTDHSSNNSASPDIATLSDGRVIAVWSTIDEQGKSKLAGATVQGGGTLEIQRLQLEQTDHEEYFSPSVSASPNGGFVIAYGDELGRLNLFEFDNSGQQVSSAKGGMPSIYSNLWISTDLEVLPDGDIVVTWDQRSKVSEFGRSSTSHVQNFDKIDLMKVSGEVNGTSVEDWIEGSSKADRLSGLEGNDRLDGGRNIDVLLGGLGDDTYILRHKRDIAEEPGLTSHQKTINAAQNGNDLVLACNSFKLPLGIEEIYIQDVIGKSGQAVDGLTAIGNNLDNLVQGNSTDNNLNGRTGNDRLTAGDGADNFIFSDRFSAQNVDQVTDFNPSQDRIFFASKLVDLAVGALDTEALHFGRLATTADHRFVFDGITLSYDPDGSGAVAHIDIATFDGAPAITADDIFIA